MGTNIFVLGLDELNHQALKKLPGAENYTFHQLLTFDELQGGSIAVNELLEEAERRLEDFDGSIDAIVGYWDFPVTAMVPILADRYGLPSANLKGIVTVEHKYWSRVEQQRVADEEVPGFGLIDLNDEEARLPEGVNYPAWIKPIKSTSSEGAYRVTDDAELQEAVAEEREVVDRMGGGFNEVLERLELPDEIAEIGGSAAMMEEEASGSMLTVEGFSYQGEVEVYGVIDSHTYEGTSNHACMVDLGLGREPQMPAQNGEFRTAATWFLRRFEDGYIKRVPTAEEVRAIEQKYPGTTIQIDKEADRPLSGDPAEDAYSFALAEIFTAGQSEEEMIETYEKVIEELNFEIEDL
ncbi:hypothetical protein HGQ17_05440 [Nesterenkonia sp. MY13]|uniref:ATP-grasp domain-containing protein n=1 Tax=Nesterenkonia sedimenti TaxID=1463632 RepID=A0A7X8YDI4_9MICC|nr:hypothetical protein [Nesterenkonia sedimenti]NLS09460.1 hypothetical protein [Nesterenkonia sedimenti]